MTTVTYFNRHENFSRMELNYLSIIKRGFLNIAWNGEFINKFFGLYDGFLYSDLLELCDKFIEDNLDNITNKVEAYRLRDDLRVVIEEVSKFPQITEERAHQINMGIY